MLLLKYKLFNLGAPCCGMKPERKTDDAACYDLYMPTAGIIKAGGTERINLQIGFEFDQIGWCLHMYGRSSAFATHGLLIPTTIIDGDYRGPVHLIAHNTAPYDFKYDRGDRLCQIQIVPVISMLTQEVDELTPTERGEGGLGSTGK